MATKPGSEPGNSPGKGDPAKGNDPTNVNAAGAFDPSKLGDEDLKKVLEDPRLWKLERLADLLKTSKEHKKLKEEQETLDKKKLEKDGKYKELLDKTQKELDNVKKARGELELKTQIIAAAVSKGIKDVDAAVKLVDTSEISQDDAGTYTGITEAVDKLAESRPFLLTQQQSSVGNPTNPGSQNAGQGKKFTMTQIQNPKFYQENREAIRQAQIEGSIEDDRPTVKASA